MKDALGNKLDKGHMVLWRLSEETKLQGLVCFVADVKEPTLSDAGGRTVGEYALIIQVPVPVTPAPNGKEPFLGDFVRIVNPAQEAAIDNLMEKVGAPSNLVGMRKQ